MQMIKAHCEYCNNSLKFNARYGLLLCPLCGAVYILEKGNRRKEKKNLKSQSAYSFECGFRDDLLPEAGLCAIRAGKAYLGYFQRVLKIGFHRSVRILDELAENGVIGKGPISGCRDILMTEDEFYNLLKRKGINL